MLISASDIIKQSVDLYKANFKLFLHYALLLLVPSVLITISSVSFPLFASMTSIGVGMLLFVLLLVISGLATLLFTTAFMKVIVARYENTEAVQMGQNIKDSMSLMLPVIWVSILTSLAVMGGFILLIIPGIIFAIWFSFGFYATVLDGKRGADALKYSKSLLSRVDGGEYCGELLLLRLYSPLLHPSSNGLSVFRLVQVLNQTKPLVLHL
jgi:hypothetical protein